VSDNDLLYLKLLLAQHSKNVINVIARIDNHGLVRGLISDDRTVALQRSDGKDFMDHEAIVRALATPAV
jgi:hypothetical protein